MRPLVILPGAGGDGSFFHHQIEYLQEVCAPQVVVLDKQNSRKEMVDYVLNEAPENFFLLGHSMGGWVAQEIASKAPERVEKLILLSSWTGVEMENRDLLKMAIVAIKAGKLDDIVQAQRPKMIYPPLLENPEFCKLLNHCQFRQPEEVYIRQLNAILQDYSTQNLLGKIATPTLIIHGRHDGLFPLPEQEALYRGIKRAKLAIIEECGHLAPIERPQALTALARLFFLPTA